MKNSAVCFLLLVFCSTFQLEAVPAQRPHPPGLDRPHDSIVRDEVVPPPVRADLKELRSQAGDLARLAASIPPDIESVGKGLVPKDTVQKLRTIEKLSKRLRDELSH